MHRHPPPLRSPSELFPFEREVWTHTLLRLQLSPQHARVLECLFHGMGDKQIAAEMNLSIETVRTYLRRMSRQFGVQGRTELMLTAVAVAQQVCRESPPRPR